MSKPLKPKQLSEMEWKAVTRIAVYNPASGEIGRGLRKAGIRLIYKPTRKVGLFLESVKMT